MLRSFVLTLLLLHNASGMGILCTQKNGCVLQDGRSVTCTGITLGQGTHILKAREGPDGKFYASADLTLVDQITVQPKVTTNEATNLAQRTTSDESATGTKESQGLLVGTVSLDNRPYTLRSRPLPVPAVCIFAAFGAPFGLCCCPCPYTGNGCWASNCHNTCGGSF